MVSLRPLLPGLVLLLSALSAAACGDDGDASSGGQGGGAGSGGGTGSGATAAGTGGAGGAGSTTATTTASTTTGAGGEAAIGCTEPTEVPCEDDVLLAMNLKDTTAPGLTSSEPEGAGWVSMIDATAGGAFTSDPHAYVYARFTDSGLEKVAISDEEALVSMDWDISFRRYVVRVNSGHSGPSCVAAARVVGAGYDEVTSLPTGLSFRKDEYFTESCELIPDGTGLEGSPATALSSFWNYPGCVQMTDQAFVIQLQDGRHLKFLVTHFYDEDTQAECQQDGAIGTQDTGSANFRVRWAFL